MPNDAGLKYEILLGLCLVFGGFSDKVRRYLIFLLSV